MAKLELTQPNYTLMKFVCSFVLFLICSSLFSQNIPSHPNASNELGRQGSWTILYDNNWQVVADTSNASFYRLIEYKDDKPVSTVRDYWASGELQTEFKMIQDRPEEILDGVVKDYSKDGKLGNFSVYSNGKYDSNKTETLLKEKVNVDPENIEFLFITGRFYYEAKGDKNKAVLYLKRYLDILRRQELNQTIDYADGLTLLGWAYLRHHDFKGAEPNFLEALSILEKHKQQEPGKYVLTLNYVGDLFRYMGRGKLGLSYLNRALTGYEEKAVQMDFPKSMIYNNMALCHELNGDYNQSIKLLLLVLEDYKRIYKGDHPEVAVVCNNLGASYSKNNQLDQGEKYFVQSRDMMKRLFGSENHLYLLTNLEIGNLYAKKLKFKEAEKIFREVHEGLAKLSKEDSRAAILSRRNYAFTLYVQGKKTQAYDILRNTALQRQEYIESYFDYLSEPARVAFYKSYAPYFNRHTSWVVQENVAHPELRSDLMNMQLRNKALLLNTSNNIKKRIMESGDRKLISLYDEAQQLRQQLGTMSTMSHEEAREKFGLDKDSLQLIYEEKDRALNNLSSLYASENKVIIWQDVQANLNKGEAVVEIVRYKVNDISKWDTTDSIRYVGLIVTAKTKNHPQLIHLTNGNLLEGRGFKQYQNSIRYQEQDQSSYELFWEPIKKALKGIKKVYLSTDGVYHKVNIGALQNPQKGAFVMDEMDVNLITSGRDIVEVRSGKLPVKLGLLIGNPAFGQLNADLIDNDLFAYEQLLASNSERAGLIDLPGAEEEVKTLQKLFNENGWKEITLINEQAEERVLKEMLKPNVLHIATHGFFQGDVSNNANRHPLYKSGLLLTGAAETISRGSDFTSTSDDTEDGVLTSFEAMNLNIDNTSLVVLSACETGLGEVVNGEGVYGLQRAFKIAGARTIIMSLWKVDDTSTQELMVKFYENWLAQGMTKREALSEAQHEMKKKYPHPYYWGAFVILGE